MKKNRNLHSILMRGFVLFSVVIIVAFILISSMMSLFFDSYIGQNTSVFFAEEVFSTNYREVDIQGLKKSGGWLMVLNEDYSMDYISEDKDMARLTVLDLVDIINGAYTVAEEKYIGTVARFVDQDGEHKVGVIVLPKENIDVKYTIINTFEGRNEFLTAYMLMILVFLLVYIFLVWSVSRRIKSSLSNPIFEINDGLASIMEGNYDIYLRMGSVDEINNIKNAFNAMAKRLKEMQNEVQREQEDKQQLYMDLSHDLRTPLTMIQGYAQRMLNSSDETKVKVKYLQAIYINAMNIAELLDVMLDYSVMNSDDFQPVGQAEDIVEFTRNIVANMFLEFENNDINIEVDIPDDVIICNYERKTLKRALSNVLNNIISHNERGISVYCGLFKRGNNAVIIIADSGREIPETIIHQMFKPFVKGDGSRQNRSHSGLGLSITEKVIERHGGSIEVIQPFQDYTKAFIIEIPCY